MATTQRRISVDIGGTFTDLLYQDENGKTVVAKVPTVPDHPDEGCIEAIKNNVLSELKTTNYFFHATTVGLNALLEMRGATVGLLTTAGFRDTLEIGRGDRAEMYNLFWNPPKSIVPRHLRLPISERMYANGAVYKPLLKEEVLKALEIFKQHNVTSIAVVYLHSYANPAHENETEQVLREAGFTGEISLSHKVTGEYREYERTCTTIINAFISQRMDKYLQHLDSSLQNMGFKGISLITQSGGGAITFKDASGKLVRTVMSGPVAGAEGAAALSRTLNLGNLVTADVGGTSFDTCIIQNGRPHLLYEGNILGLPVQVPWVDIRSIGAGGGSLVYLAEGGRLCVGPQSAGANPGPACYGKGGVSPTLTDAACVLGMYGSGKLASGLTLDRDKALKSLEPISKILKLNIFDLCSGIVTIACAAMSNAIKEITVENGVDPRELKLIAFGGAGPLFSGFLADELNIQTIILPPHPGNFSAWGLLGADIVYTQSITKLIKVTEDYLQVLNPVLLELISKLKHNINNSKNEVFEVGLDIRYDGQEYTLTIYPENNKGQLSVDAKSLKILFENRFKEIYGITLDNELEIVSVRATIRLPLPEQKLTLRKSEQTIKATTIDVYSFCQKKHVAFKLIDRNSLEQGDKICGPIILTEYTSTTYVDSDKEIEAHPSGCVFVHKKQNK